MSKIEFKDVNVLRSLFMVQWDGVLIDLLVWMVVRYDKLLFTSGFRLDDPGVHGQMPLRGFDLRSTVYENPQKICDDVNEHWVYDTERPEKKVAMLHDVGQGIHFHFQVHPRTVYKK